MPYVKLDTSFCDHPKVVGLSAEAFRTFVLSLCYAQAHLTDGAVLQPLVARWGGRRVVAELVTARLWEEAEESLRIHDYLDYNRSRAQVERIRSVRKANGNQGGRPRENQTGTEHETKMVSSLDRVWFQHAKPRGTEVQRTEVRSDAAASDAGGDEAFSESYGELITAYGGPITQRLADEFSQIAEEFESEEIRSAIRSCRSANQRCYPSNLRRHLPDRSFSKPVPLDDLITFPWLNDSVAERQ